MAILYSKGGEKVVIPHAIDVKDWLDGGYSLEDPSEAKQVEPKGGDSLSKTDADGAPFDLSTIESNPTPEAGITTAESGPKIEAEWFESVKDKLGTLGADDARRAANYVGVEYTNKRDAIAAIKDTLK